MTVKYKGSDVTSKQYDDELTGSSLLATACTMACTYTKCTYQCGDIAACLVSKMVMEPSKIDTPKYASIYCLLNTCMHVCTTV